jgi:hypothetical protein
VLHIVNHLIFVTEKRHVFARVEIHLKWNKLKNFSRRRVKALQRLKEIINSQSVRPIAGLTSLDINRGPIKYEVGMLTTSIRYSVRRYINRRGWRRWIVGNERKRTWPSSSRKCQHSPGGTGWRLGSLVKITDVLTLIRTGYSSNITLFAS